MSRRLRHRLGQPVEAHVPAGLRINTGLPVSEADRAVVLALGWFLDRLSGADLATRCRAGPEVSKPGWADRKRTLTAHCSSRWAGWTVRADPRRDKQTLMVLGTVRGARRQGFLGLRYG